MRRGGLRVLAPGQASPVSSPPVVVWSHIASRSRATAVSSSVKLTDARYLADYGA